MLNMNNAVAGGRVLSSSSPVRSCWGGDLLSVRLSVRLSVTHTHTHSLSLSLSLSILQERDWVRYVGHMRI